MSFPAHQSYKGSGVEWIGNIPEHWTVHRINELYREFAEPGHVDLPILSVSIHNGVSDDEVESDDESRKIARSDDRSKYKQVRPNDLVYNMMRAWQGGFGTVKVPGMVSPAYVVARPKHGVPSSLVELMLRTSGAIEEMRRRSKGVTDFRLRLYWDEFKDMRIALPPTREQSDIMDFLDRETAKIDALVEEQQRLIALLKEKRQAVISRAVTKGLNPNVPMKESGIEWLGEVPAHWDTLPIRSVARLESGHTPSRSQPDWWTDCTIPWFTLGDIWQIREEGRKFIYKTTELVSELGLANSSARLLPKGTVMLSRTASVGFAAIMGVDMATTQDFANWVCGPRLNNEFLWFVFQAMADEFKRIRYGSTHNTIYMPDIAAFRLGLPPSMEQLAIVRHLEIETKKFDNLMKQAELASALFKERRAALISAAVTGKIDVRGAAKVLLFPIDRVRARGLIAAEIIERSAHQAIFGRVKLQKIAYLAEAHVGIAELEGAYLREAAGPLDREMIHEMEHEAGSLAGIRVEQPYGAGSAVAYRLGDRRGAHRQNLAALLGDRAAKFDKLIEDIGTIDTKGAEAVATLYAVWNDALIDGETPADMEIKLAVLTEWHPEKAKKFRLDELQIWLDWMRRHDLIPTGTGPKTSTGRLFA